MPGPPRGSPRIGALSALLLACRSEPTPVDDEPYTIADAVRDGAPTSWPREAPPKLRRALELAKLPGLGDEVLIDAPHGKARPCAPDVRRAVDAVGAIVRWDAVTRTMDVWCTATAISPRRIVTAGHCIWDPSDARYAWYFVDAPYALAGPFDHALVAPRRFAGLDLGRADLATSSPLSALATYPTLARAPQDEGRDVMKVGYGWWTNPAATDPAIATVVGYRICATMTVSEVRADEYTYVPKDPPGGQICSHDSGGPAFFASGGTIYLGGVTRASRHDTPLCGEGGTDVRLSSDAQAWLRADM